MARTTGTYATTTTLGEPVKAFIPHPLPPSEPGLAESAWADRNRAAQMALARLAAVAGLVPSVDWLLYSAIRKEALMTSQIEGTQATLTDLFDEEAGLAVSNTDDVEEVTNYLRAFRLANVHLLFGDGMAGYAQGAPYAGIVAAAGGNDVPQAWIEQLAVGGRLVAPAVTDSGQQHLIVIERHAHGFTRSVLEPVLFVPLKSGVS